jgi:DNA-binding NarL/FixJ family response regulator
MYIVLVEDDHLQSEWVTSCLTAAFHGAIVEPISTESAFYAWLDALTDILPDVFVIDVMLRWTDPSPNMQEPPQEVKDNGFYRAGLRCKDKIMKHENTRDIPVILYTVLEELDLEGALQITPPNVRYLRKDSEADPLIELIREVTRP